MTATITHKFTCGKAGCASQYTLNYGEEAPLGWVMFREPPGMAIPAMIGWTDTKWFCSKKCLLEWLQEQKEEKAVIRTLITCDRLGCRASSMQVADMIPDGWMRYDPNGAMLDFCSEQCLEATLKGDMPPMSPGAKADVERRKR